MPSVIAIARRELAGYLASPTPYVVIALFTLLYGYFFVTILGFFVHQSTQMSQLSEAGLHMMNVNQMLIRPLLQNVTIFLLFLLPALTMQVATENRRSGTIDLPTGSPNYIEIVIGKFLGVLTLYAVMLAVTAVHMAVLFIYGSPELNDPDGISRTTAARRSFLSVGLFISTLATNQIVAATVTFTVFLLLWVISWPGSLTTVANTNLLAYLSVIEHFDDFSKGVIDSTHVVYYLSLITLGLCLCTLSQWRVSASAFGARSEYHRTLAFSIALVTLGILIPANYAGRSLNKRWDFTANKQFSLSDQTTSALATLEAPLRVLVFSQESDFPRYQDKLKEYQYSSKNVTTEYIDPEKNSAVAKQNDIKQFGTIVFNYKGRTERVTTDTEQDITNGIIKVVSGRQSKVYFTSGHGEKDITSSARDGYDAIATAVGQDNYIIDKLVVAQRGSIPTTRLTS